MNNQFNENIAKWLDTTEAERDYAAGALMLLQLNRNQIMYRRIMANLDRHHKDIEYQLSKFLTSRSAACTHAEVKEMSAKAEVIARTRNLGGNKPKEYQKGKRGDHDSLPAEIQSLYVENLSILQRMRYLHTQLRIISDDTKGQYCPDSDRYPLLKELIALDTKYRKNWQQYDDYDAEAGKVVTVLHPREEQKKYIRLVNLNKGKYANNPNDLLAAQIRDWYEKIDNPTEKMKRELTDLGIL